MRTLVVMRHGKSGYPEGVPDFERPLAERGRRQAALAGDWMREHLEPIDAVLCSAATRTRETLAATGIEAPAEFLDDIYGAWPGALLEVLRTAPADAETVLMVGHAPGMPALAETLAGESSDPALLREIRAGFPTSAVAVLQTATAWSQINPGDATLVDYVVAR